MSWYIILHVEKQSLLPSLEQGSTPAMPLRVLSLRIRDDQHAGIEAWEGRLFHLVNFAPWRCLVRTIKILDLSQYYSPCYISFTLTKCARICLQKKIRYSCSEVFHLSRHHLSIFLQAPLFQFSHGRWSSEIYRKDRRKVRANIRRNAEHSRKHDCRVPLMGGSLFHALRIVFVELWLLAFF